MSRAVFLDRDGTMIEDVGYLDRLQRLKLFPYTVDAIRLLNRAGFKIVVVTSQAGIANGVITEAFVNEAHHEIGRRKSRIAPTATRSMPPPHRSPRGEQPDH